MNEKQIELLKNEIDFLERKMNEADELRKSLYKNQFEELNNLFKSSYEIRNVKENLENKLELYQMLTEKGIDTNKKYYLVDDIYLSLSDLRPYFYIEDGQWIYNDYINSWSGMNEWITELINQEYSLFSGNSPYCYAFGTMDIKDIFKCIEDKDRKNSEKLGLIENLVEFTKEDGKFKEIHDVVVRMIKFKLSMMKEYLEK
jgi:hypothetical protein